MTAQGKRRLLGFLVAVIILVALNAAISFGQLRVLLFGLQFIFVVGTVFLLVRMKLRRQATNEKLLKKISDLAEAVKEESDDMSARRARRAHRKRDVNGRN